MTTQWMFLVPTDTGPQPFAILFTEPACDFLLRLVFDAAAVVGACVPFVSGVAS